MQRLATGGGGVWLLAVAAVDPDIHCINCLFIVIKPTWGRRTSDPLELYLWGVTHRGSEQSLYRQVRQVTGNATQLVRYAHVEKRGLQIPLNICYE